MSGAVGTPEAFTRRPMAGIAPGIIDTDPAKTKPEPISLESLSSQKC